MPTAPVIEVTDLRKSYAGRPAVDGVSFAVEEGGSSGSSGRTAPARPPPWRLIVDDHPVVRDGPRGMFESAPGFTVLAEASNGVEAVSLATGLDPDVRPLRRDGRVRCA